MIRFNYTRVAYAALLLCVFVGTFTVVFQTIMHNMHRTSYFDPLSQKDIGTILRRINFWGKSSDSVLTPCLDIDGVPQENINLDYGFLDQLDFLPDYKNPCWLNEKDHLKCLPYFYVVGAVQAEMTDLYSRIMMHPEVANMTRVERSWFDTERFSSKENSKLPSYIGRFRSAFQEIKNSVNESGFHYKIIGDDSPTTLFGNDHWMTIPGNEWCQEPRVTSLAQIHLLNPMTKFIFTLRNPSESLYSEYLAKMRESHGEMSPWDFQQRVIKSIDAFRACTEKRSFRRCLYGPESIQEVQSLAFTAGIYSRHIIDTLQIFPRKQILIIEAEDYKLHPIQHLRKIFEFLELDPLPFEELRRIANRTIRFSDNSEQKHAAAAAPIFPKTLKILFDFYGPFNDELAILMNNEQFMWKIPPRRPTPKPKIPDSTPAL